MTALGSRSNLPLVQVLHRPEPQLVEPDGHRHDRRAVAQVDERITPPPVERRPQTFGRVDVVEVRGDQLEIGFELVGVDRELRIEPVSGSFAANRLDPAAERAPEPGDVHLHRLSRLCLGTLRPQSVDELVERHRSPPGRGEDPEDESLLRPTQCQAIGSGHDFQRSEYRQLHFSTVLPGHS